MRAGGGEGVWRFCIPQWVNVTGGFCVSTPVGAVNWMKLIMTALSVRWFQMGHSGLTALCVCLCLQGTIYMPMFARNDIAQSVEYKHEGCDLDITQTPACCFVLMFIDHVYAVFLRLHLMCVSGQFIHTTMYVPAVI